MSASREWLRFTRRLCSAFAVTLCATRLFASSVFINEILFNPPGSSDVPNEYIELRGTPNLILSNGTYFVAVEGDTNGNPGTIQNVFDLSGRAIGGNGFLVLLQNSNSYLLNTNCFALINTNGSGFGSGGSSTVHHRGEGGQTDLENGSVTFFLIQSTNFPSIGSDIDTNNDGVLDGALFASWTVLDSVAVLDNDGFGDIGYGKINFRRSTAPGSNATVVSGTIVSVNFTPAYVARAGNTTNWLASSWVASGNLTGTVPNWSLDGTDTVPVSYTNGPLNHIGGPNFGAANVPGAVARESGFSTDVTEGFGTDSYTLGLNTVPSGNVTITIAAGSQVQISIDGGLNFFSTRTVTFSNTSPVTVLVRALDDNVVDVSPRVVPITHVIVASGDSANYPASSLTPIVNVRVSDNDSLLLSELKVNPPGTNDAPYEFIEIRGAPNALLTNVFLVVIEGNQELDPGTANVVIDLTGEQIGSSGVLLIVADGNPYSVPAGAHVVLASQLNRPGGALGNGSISFLLVTSPSAIAEGTDLDAGDNGILEGLPSGTTILDSVVWLDGGGSDVVYSPAVLVQASGAPDAATRIGGNTNANSATAWVFGEFEGSDPFSLSYANEPTVPYGTQLTPGAVNNIAPKIAGLAPFSSVIGDPTTPMLTFQISDAESPVGSLSVSVISSNQLVVPDANLILGGTGGTRTLAINPIGVGYATIVVSVSDGNVVGRALIPFAASADFRGGGRFHTGASDGSAAIAVDANYMFVGDDENQVIRLYQRHQSGAPVNQFDFTPFLALPDIEAGVRREVDIEASTRVGNRLYWFGSHSHANIGETRTNRTRIFATDLSGTGSNAVLTYVGRYDFFKSDLINWDSTNGHGKGANYYGLAASDADGVPPKAPDGSGFAIEGLAMMPGSTNGAYVAFRAPIVPATNRTFALIVPVLNFTSLTTNAPPGSSRFGSPIEFDLYDRGIRSLEGNSNGYLLIGGPAAVSPTEYPHDFRLYTWTGNPVDAPQQRAADLSGLNPEAIVELPLGFLTSTSQVQLVSDNGITDFYGDGMEAKELPEPNFKKSRSDVVTLGAVVKPSPVLRSISMSNFVVRIAWRSLKGETYRVQSESVLSQTNWVDASGNILAAGPFAAATINASGATRFYRVVLQP